MDCIKRQDWTAPTDTLTYIVRYPTKLDCLPDMLTYIVRYPTKLDCLPNKRQSGTYPDFYLAFDTEPAREAVIVTRAKAFKDPGAPVSRLSQPVTILLLHCVNEDGVDALSQLDFLPDLSKKDASQDGKLNPVRMPAEVTRIFKIAPSTCNLRVAPGGKGFWMQTHNVKNRHTVYPARCLMGFDVTTSQIDQLPSRLSPSEVVMLKDKPSMLTNANDLHFCKNAVYSRRCDMGEILRKKYSVVTADLEDTVGRIAIGDRCGKIEVLDYA